MACRDEDSDLSYIDASHLFPNSVIKIGFRHSRHLSTYQFDFLHMMAPYLEPQTIRKVIESKTPQSRKRLIEDAEVPSFRELKKSLNE
jgi:LysR family cys regulon transcriptional activator